MSDIALGISTGTFDDIAGRIHLEQHQSYFTGTTSFSDGGVDYRLDWDVVRPPLFDLTSDVDHGGLARAAVRGELVLEPLDVRPTDEPSRLDDVPHRLLELGAELGVLPAKVEERDAHVVAQ